MIIDPTPEQQQAMDRLERNHAGGVEKFVDRATQPFDDVQKPKHYNSHPSGVESIEIKRRLGPDWGDVWKYVYRAELKNGLQDLEKALWYAKDAIEHNIPVRSPQWTPYETALLNGIMDYEPAGTRRGFFRAVQDQDPDLIKTYVELLIDEWGDAHA